MFELASLRLPSARNGRKIRVELNRQPSPEQARFVAVELSLTMTKRRLHSAEDKDDNLDRADEDSPGMRTKLESHWH